MSRSLGNCIADSLELCLGYSERLLKDVTPQQFARFAAPGGVVIESNHPAFVFGHLSLYGPRILTQLNLPAPTIPEGFEAAFSKDAKCVDDPSGTVYPSMDAVVKFYFEGYRAAVSALKRLRPSRFSCPPFSACPFPQRTPSPAPSPVWEPPNVQIGRASCRERV